MKTVCVTGGGGYVASWVVKLLLQRGYTVRASVRDPGNAKKTAHLAALEGAKERLELFKADLLAEGSFDDAIDGCDGVFHTASPFHDNLMTDPQAEMIDPAVKGTLNVLAASAKSKTVKRVVLTSSIAANALTQKPLTPDVVVDESWWSDVDFCRQIQQWYCLSKTLAESAAWEFAKGKGIDMVTLNPGMIIGPLLQPTLNTSAAWILNLISGAETYANATFGWIDVRDVAKAHVLAYENPAAAGRCLLIKVIIHQSEMVHIIHHLYPTLKLPQKCADDKPFPPKYQVSQAKAKALGIEFLPFEQSIKDTIESLRQKNLVDSSISF